MLSREPQDINESAWYYEKGRGLELIHYVNNRAEYVTIPWKKILKSVERYSAAKQKSRAKRNKS